MRDYPAVVISGPTASGKSQLGKYLAQEWNGEIISCDALQVYRGMDIGTAKATVAERRAIPHHMLDLREPWEDFSAGEYQRLGRQALHQVRERARLPFIIGGTGFYLRALIGGLFKGPERSEELRKRMRRIVQRKGTAYLHRSLRRADPISADRIAPADTARIIRAFEVYLLTGRPLSWWHRQPADRLEGFRWLKLGIAWPRPSLYQRIDVRVDEMFRNGFVEEVRRLLDSVSRECHALKALGYRQIAQHLEGRMSLDQAMEETKRESRRYAKRQVTWFHSDPSIVWLDATVGEEKLQAQSFEIVRSFLT